MSGTVNVQHSAATEKLHHWILEILAMKAQPKIEYKKGSSNLITDSLSWLRMGKHYQYNELLNNTEPKKLEEKAEVNMIQTSAKIAEQENIILKLPELQIKSQDIFKTWQMSVDHEHRPNPWLTDTLNTARATG